MAMLAIVAMVTRVAMVALLSCGYEGYRVYIGYGGSHVWWLKRVAMVVREYEHKILMPH